MHSYGQGGAGWSLSFGCAQDDAALVEVAMHDLLAENMAIFEPLDFDLTQRPEQQYLWSKILPEIGHPQVRARL